MNPVGEYVSELRRTRASGLAVNETSYYPALQGLLTAVGTTLRPKVHCVMTPRNQGAGIPDAGLFTADQLQDVAVVEFHEGMSPARGVVEVKGTGDDVAGIARSEQVRRYLQGYGQVLVTNYRDFLLVGKGPGGEPIPKERYSLAESEAEFWAAAQHPERLAADHCDRLLDYLKRVLLHPAPLATPKEVAWFLASYAREARARLGAAELPALNTIRRALEEALGIEFREARGEHFFRSTLVQTLFYGVFSAWVLWNKQRAPGVPAGAFDWGTAARSLRVPIVRKLYHELVEPGRLDALDLSEVLDWAGDALNRVDWAEFQEHFEEEHAVQYFYEPFLEEFDPALRKELGVWYTPPEIVRYMVARVDTVLREELGLADGLADESVVVLDPCCGTGAYLVEVIRRIGKTLRERGGDALVASDLRKAVVERVFGFEILPAPFVVAHLQMGLLLQSENAPLSEGARAGIYLTNALTGWDPLREPQRLLYPEMEEERDAAMEVKQGGKVLVILGNPPYNGFAGMAVEEERGLSDAYRETRHAPKPQGQGLNDLYVRFFRMAERAIVERKGRGVVCFISNYSWLDGLSFTGMRERYLDVFDRIWIDCLNGDKYKTGKLTPEGKPDPSVFSTEWNREGIQVGTAVALLVRKQEHTGSGAIRFRNLWGRRKRAELLATADPDGVTIYDALAPELPAGLPFMPGRFEAGYFRWPLLPEVFPFSSPGVTTSRDDFVVDVDRGRLERLLLSYFDRAVSHAEMQRIAPGAMAATRLFDAETTRQYLQQRGFLPENVVRYCYRPFDLRWLYWEPETKLLDRNRAEYFRLVTDGNPFLFTTGQTRKYEAEPPLATQRLTDYNCMDSGARGFPLYVASQSATLFGTAHSTGSQPNLSDEARTYLSRVDADEMALFCHTLATIQSPTYREENAGALRQDWPRIPLPAERELLLASAELGRQVAALLDPETPVPGVTQGALRAELRMLGVVSREGGGALDPEAGDLAVTAGWGHAGKGGVTMPARGKTVPRDYTPDETGALAEGAAALGLAPEEALRLLGEHTLDVYLNGVAYWRCVPKRVWEYTLGGYQVIKKWLSYRERPLLGRDLTPEEAREVSGMVRRIAAILMLEPALNAGYQAVKAAASTWPPGEHPI